MCTVPVAIELRFTACEATILFRMLLYRNSGGGSGDYSSLAMAAIVNWLSSTFIHARSYVGARTAQTTQYPVGNSSYKPTSSCGLDEGLGNPTGRTSSGTS
jgi:hypothetical protein